MRKWFKKAAALAVAALLAAPVAVSLNVASADEDVELLPIAKWEFNDEDTKMRDTMGNYDLTVAAIEGGNTANPRDTGVVVDGKLVVDGDDALTLPDINDIGEHVNNGFTLNFETQLNAAAITGNDTWMAPVSFGFNDWNAGVYCRFLANQKDGVLRPAAHKITVNRDGSGEFESYWAEPCLEDTTSKLSQITMSVRPGGQFKIFVDGQLVMTKDVPEKWSPAHANMKFTIGAETVWGNAYCFWNGTIDDVSVYNFAMNESQVAAFWADKKIMKSEMGGEVITSISNQPKFTDDKVTLQNLTDALTTTQLVKRMNTATVDAIFENENTVSVPVTWTKMEYVDTEDKYYVVGEVNTSDIGYATLLTGKTEIRTEVEVTRKTRNVVIDEEIENGTVEADKESALLREVVTFTVTPANGYKLVEFTINGDVIEADENGKFTYKVDCNGDIEVYAEFEATGSDGGNTDGGNTDGGNTDGGNTDGGNTDGGALAGCMGSIGLSAIALLPLAAVKLFKKED